MCGGSRTIGSLFEKMQAYQIPSELVILEGEGHATPKFWTTPAYQEKVLAFLKTYL